MMGDHVGSLRGPNSGDQFARLARLGDGEPAPAFRGTGPAEGLADRGQSFEGRQQLGAVVGEALLGIEVRAEGLAQLAARLVQLLPALAVRGGLGGVAQATLDGGQPVVGIEQVRVELQGPAIMRRGGGPVAGAFPGLAAEDPEIGLGLRNGRHPGQDRVEGIHLAQRLEHGQVVAPDAGVLGPGIQAVSHVAEGLGVLAQRQLGVGQGAPCLPVRGIGGHVAR